METFTLDTNAVIAYWNKESSGPAVEKIIQYAEEGRINLAVVTRAVADLDHDKNVAHKQRQLQRLKRFQRVGTILRFDTPGSTFDGPDFFVNEKSFDKLKNILFPGLNRNHKKYMNNLYDVDHLYGHIQAGRNIFVTSEKNFLNKKEKMREIYGIKICTPEESLEQIGNTEEI